MPGCGCVSFATCGRFSLAGCGRLSFCFARAMSQATSDGRSSSGRNCDSGTPSELAACVSFSARSTSPAASALRAADRSSCACCFEAVAGVRELFAGALAAVCFGGIKPEPDVPNCLIARAARQRRTGQLPRRSSIRRPLAASTRFAYARPARDDLAKSRPSLHASMDS